MSQLMINIPWTNSAATLQPINISKDSHFAEHMEKGLLLPGGQAGATVCETLDGHDESCHAESASPLAVRWGGPWHLQSLTQAAPLMKKRPWSADDALLIYLLSDLCGDRVCHEHADHQP